MYSKLNSFLTVLLVLFCLSSSEIFAQTITGTVKDAKTEEPLAGANIIQVGTSKGVAAGTDGSFTLELREGASDEISISFIGYRTKTISTSGQSEDLEILLMPKSIMSNEVFVKALRVDEATPMAFENVSRDQINKKNLGQDIPYLVSSTPSVTTTSDAGTGIGYTGIRIRGVDQARINVTINGIPLNDAESHGVFWVDLPDLASSVENIQIQRGVGTSTNGAAAFGATMNLQTSEMRPNAYGEVNAGIGSFNTQKMNVLLGSGLMDNGWQFEGRLSKITSDGYIDRASSDLKSFYLSGARHGDNSLLRADVFSGVETTYQSWYGVPEELLDSDRTYNPAGQEKPGEPYEDQTDNYQQDHYQLHYSYQFSENWDANASVHYTYGRGYYEEYKADQSLSQYQIEPIDLPNTTITESDLVRQLWLDNHFYGTVFSTQYQKDNNFTFTFGGGYNEYDGDHYGEVIWAEYLGNTDVENRYYDNNAFKTDGNLYAKLQYYFTDNLSGYVDMQTRRITYDFLGKDKLQAPGGGQQIVDVQQTDRLTFFNPKAGLVYRKGNHRLFASFSVGNKEPTRDEYVNSTPENRPEHETMYDWEAGYKAEFDRFFAGLNLYFMDYKNQLIPTGELNDVGSAIRQNVPDSYRAGIELQAGVRILPELEWSGNATFSRNKIDEYEQFIDVYDASFNFTGQESRTYEDTDISFSPSFIGNSILSFTENGFSSELVTKYVSRQYLDNTQTDARSIDPYLVNDIRLGYNFSSIPVLSGLRANLQVNNIFDKKYETNGYTFGYIAGGDEQYFNYYYPQAGRNFRLQLSFRF
ncbi:TonB-dependent receptor [Balneolaceae bacterium YR4-1]|uniref:TonB-dependent receptor n=1 Tax=Halalkalibaculum roseum TaxID=2709311 RepID=A0A6M1SZU7_9BACT|nr:TonB-dependent receptor [Halalkalibaculum roseum]NGP77406.1 TonB-dependent receptor [Halalkalibaculum roseum]